MFLEASNALNDWRTVSLHDAQKQLTLLDEKQGFTELSDLRNVLEWSKLTCLPIGLVTIH